MKLDAKLLRYLDHDHFRVLTACEMGSRNHEVVPTQLITNLASLKHGGIQKIISHLARNNLIAKVQNNKYDGYRLTYGGYDYLALKTLSKRDTVFSIGNQIGVGKESDIIIVADATGQQIVLKLHRLGRTSFRNIKEKRDYLRNRKTTSWLYMARLAATKEFAFMKVLYDNGFPVPKPIDQNRHCILMELIDATPLCQVKDFGNPGKLYSDLMNLVVRLANSGLIHGDFNEFNLLITADGTPILIDFPQMVSTSHVNAQMYFDRDINCIRTFFQKRFNYVSVLFPVFNKSNPSSCVDMKSIRLDEIVNASGFSKKMMNELEVFQEHLESNPEDAQCNLEEPEDESEDEFEDEVTSDDNIAMVIVPDVNICSMSRLPSESCPSIDLASNSDQTKKIQPLPEHERSLDTITEFDENGKDLDDEDFGKDLDDEDLSKDLDNEDFGKDPDNEDFGKDLDNPDNKSHAPYRDESSKRQPSAFAKDKVASLPRRTLDKADIRKIVQHSLAKKRSTHGKNKNFTKASRNNREYAKQTNEDYF